MSGIRQIAKATVFGAIGGVKRATARTELRYRTRGHALRIMLGAGPHCRDGWISTDIAIRLPSTIYMDIARRFPLKDASVDAFFMEHVIEHVSYDIAARMLTEIYRTLIPGGIVRIATPDLRQVARTLNRGDNEASIYVSKGNERWNRRPNVSPIVPAGQLDNPCFTVNRMFYHWGHRFIYDEPTLSYLLAGAGFAEIERCAVGESEHEHMRDLERHGTAIDPSINAFETMVVEAVKS